MKIKSLLSSVSPILESAALISSMPYLTQAWTSFRKSMPTCRCSSGLRRGLWKASPYFWRPFSNVPGHVFKVIAFYLIYKAIIQAGLVTPYTLLFRDVKLSEDALRESRKQLQTIIETEPECVKLLDSSGALLEMNPAGFAMIQADSIGEVRDRVVYPLVAEEHREAFIDAKPFDLRELAERVEMILERRKKVCGKERLAANQQVTRETCVGR